MKKIKNPPQKKEKQTKVITLPQTLIDDINQIGLSKSQLNHTYKLIQIILDKSYKYNGNYTSYVELPTNYLRKVFSGHYTKWFNKLKNDNILTTYKNNEGIESYSTGNYSKMYCINTKYMLDNSINSIVYMSPLFKFTDEEEKINAWVKEDLKELTINKNKMYNYMNNVMDNLTIDNFKTNDDITETSFQVEIKEAMYATPKFFTTLEGALERIKDGDRMLIQDKRRFIIQNPNEFIINKKNAYKIYYTDAIFKLSNGIFLGKRNDTNNRLDTNLTNLCAELTNIIIEENNLVQLDLSNSQFAILSHILPYNGESDIKRFKELSYSGELYDYIKEELSLETRKEAKQVTFELLFSSYNNKSQKLKKLKEVFPNVIEFINNYKKENGSENFAIMLQKIESKMFIDDIWMTLKQDGYFALTKHDSIICKKEDEKYITNFIQMYFDSIGFEGKLSNK
ncbi:MAG: hypothetical protein GY870_06640 [archaeon]|nr:hypothetical protein [archaeon]